MTTKTVSEIVAELSKKYKGDRAKVKAALILEGYSEKAANEAIREAGMIRKMGDFREALYERLSTGPLTKAEFSKMITGATNNAKKHESHYWSIAELVNSVYAGKKSK